MNQQIVFENWIQFTHQEILILTMGPWFVQIGFDKRTHTFQEFFFETPQASHKRCGMLGMIPNDMRPMRRIHEFMNGPTIPYMNPTIRIPNHHEIHAVLVQCQKPIHHKNGSGFPSVPKNDLGKLKKLLNLRCGDIRTQLHENLPLRKVG